MTDREQVFTNYAFNKINDSLSSELSALDRLQVLTAAQEYLNLAIRECILTVIAEEK